MFLVLISWQFCCFFELKDHGQFFSLSENASESSVGFLPSDSESQLPGEEVALWVLRWWAMRSSDQEEGKQSCKHSKYQPPKGTRQHLQTCAKDPLDWICSKSDSYRWQTVEVLNNTVSLDRSIYSRRPLLMHPSCCQSNTQNVHWKPGASAFQLSRSQQSLTIF